MADRHQQEITARRTGITMRTLADKWGCSVESVRQIAFERLPYVLIGAGSTRHHRRYLPADVAAYEAGRSRVAA